jgi:curved DNA-binding protein CbpA
LGYFPIPTFRSNYRQTPTIFGFDRTPTQADVKKQYRTLAKQYHPDTGGNEEEFKRLNQANQVLMQHFA